MRLSDKTLAVVGASLGPGLSPFAPGTFGTLPAVLLHWCVAYFAPTSLFTPFIIAALVVSCVLSLALAPASMRHWGTEDPGKFTLDEVAGYLLTVLLAPSFGVYVDMAAIFLLFRLFDIAKPFPVRWADERFKGPVGILLDDLFAGCYAALVLAGVAFAVA